MLITFVIASPLCCVKICPCLSLTCVPAQHHFQVYLHVWLHTMQLCLQGVCVVLAIQRLGQQGTHTWQQQELPVLQDAVTA